VRKFWALFFMFWPIVAVVSFLVAPARNWWFPSEAFTPLGERIDDLFYLILYLTAAVFVATQIALGYVLWVGAKERGGKALFTHGSHNLEVIWTIVPAGILLFIALYQMDVWAEYRVQSNFPEAARRQPIAEVTARQFEWRIRYPAPGTIFKDAADVKDWLLKPRAGDLYTVNDLHLPVGRPVMIHLRSGDVQHSFFVPALRVKQDAVPGLVIPVWFEVTKADKYEWVCAELCGWGHYKMKARVWAQSDEEFQAYLTELQQDQFDDGVPDASEQPDDESLAETR
jgi:cytochrome c oxidase subunit 2